MKKLSTQELLEQRDILKETKNTTGFDKVIRARQAIELELGVREKMSQLGIRIN
jgi:hypothetical protein